jgi:hypothetical protein
MNPSRGPDSMAPVSGRPLERPRHWVLGRIASIGASAQAAIPGLYAWSITVAPAAWSRGSSWVAKGASLIGVLALVTAPVIEATTRLATANEEKKGLSSWTGPTWARIWSVWGLVLSSAIVWALAPAALSSARLDGVRGSLGIVGWALFAFASAGPVLQHDPASSGRSVRSTSLKPRSEVPRGDGVYVAVGVVAALSMQAVGWGVAAPERAVLVRLVTVVCGVAVIGGTTSIALARHVKRVPASRRVRLRRALPWFVVLAVIVTSGMAVLAMR